MRLKLTRPQMAAGIVVACMLGIAAPATAHVPYDTSPAAEKRLTKQVLDARRQAAITGASIVRGDWGYWDATTREAYIDTGGRIAHVKGAKLAYLDPGPSEPAGVLGGGGPVIMFHPAVCHDNTNLTHCEQSLNKSGCNPTYAYLRYDDLTDNFSGQYGAPIYPGEWMNVRNAPYRKIGPRGVRIYRIDRWLFMSDNCL